MVCIPGCAWDVKINNTALSSEKLQKEVDRQIDRGLQLTAGDKMPEDATGPPTRDEQGRGRGGRRQKHLAGFKCRRCSFIFQ